MEMHPQKVQGMSMQMQTHKRKQKETRDHQNSRNEVENATLKEHPMPKGALAGVCGRDEELENNNA